MPLIKTKEAARHRRKKRIRKNLNGTSGRPRLSVFRSLNHIYAQAIDDATGKTVIAASSLDKVIKDKAKKTGNKDAAKLVGELIAQRCKENGIETVVFDRSGDLYH